MATAQRLSIDESHCVLCWEDIEYSACGSCDHPICLKCCVKLRLLRKEYDCPVCRAQLKEVIVSKGFKSWADKTKPRRQQHARNYGILHETSECQAKVDELLEHRCLECGELFRSFQQVKDHVRKAHSMMYCDICLRNLKIFTHERKCYTREALVKHRKEGDADDRSHRGHPLCQFCDERYLDNDELLSHLRRNHFWCHLCEKDGSQEYYPHYKELRKHFKQAHFLCEEGECFHEKFTSVFRMKVDYQAHIAQKHSDRLSKAEARQMRQLDVNITFAIREDSDGIVSGRGFSFPEQGQERYRDRSNRMTNDSQYGESRDPGRYKANNRERDQEPQQRFPQDRKNKVDSERYRQTEMGIKDMEDQRVVKRISMRTSRDVLEGDHKRPPGDPVQEDYRRILEGNSGKSKVHKADKDGKSGTKARESEYVRSRKENNKKKELSDERLGSGRGKQQSLDEGNFSGKGKKTEASLSKTKIHESKESSFDQKADSTNQKVDSTNQKVDSTNQKVDSTNQKVDSTNQKADSTNQKADSTNQKADSTNQKADSTNQKVDSTNQKADSKKEKADNEKRKADNEKWKADNERWKADNEKWKADNEKQKADNEKWKADNEKWKADNEKRKADSMNQKADNKSKTKNASNNNLIQEKNAQPSLQGSSVVHQERNTGPSPSSVVRLVPDDFPALSSDDKQGTIVNIVKPRPTYDSEFPTLSNESRKSNQSIRPPPGLSAPPGFSTEVVKSKPKQRNTPEAIFESKQNFEQVGNPYKATTTSKQPQKEILNLEKSLVNKSAANSKTSVPNKPVPKRTYDSEFPTLSTLINGHKSSSSIKAPPGLAPPRFQPGIPARPPPGMGWSVPLKTGGSSAKETRSQTLINDIRRILNLRGESFENFRQVSICYRQGKISPEVYYQQCCELLGEEHIHKVFRELIDLLPDEDKQRRLLLVYNDAKVKAKLEDSVKEGSGVQFNTENVPATEKAGSGNNSKSTSQPSLEDDFPALPKATGKKSKSAGNVTSTWTRGK